MKALTTGIYSKLVGSSLNTAVGGRFYDTQASDSAVYPYVVYFVVSDVPDNTFTEVLESVMIQFSIFSTSSSSGEAKDIFENLKSLYDNCIITITGETMLYMVRGMSSLNTEEHTTLEGTQKVWHLSVDYDLMTLVA